MKLPNRKSPRKVDYNYANHENYFVTICTKDRKPYFWYIKNGRICLNDLGTICRDIRFNLPKMYPHIKLHNFIVMPDHIHILIEILKEWSVGAPFMASEQSIKPSSEQLIWTMFDKSIWTKPCKPVWTKSGNPEFTYSGKPILSDFDKSISIKYEHHIRPEPKSGQFEASVPKMEDQLVFHADTINRAPTFSSLNHAPTFGLGLKWDLMQNTNSLWFIIRYFKWKCSYLIRKKSNKQFEWQRSYHDHIILFDLEFDRILNYISNNPKKWKLNII